jgi:hypothetical protein
MYEALAPALQMERDLAWADTVDTWLADEYARGRRAIVGALSPGTLRWLRDEGLPVPPTAEIAIGDDLPIGPKQRRHEAGQDALTAQDWRAVPQVLREGAVYYQVAGSRLIFVADGIGPAKLAVAFEPRASRSGVSRIVSGFRTSAEAVAGMVSGRQWRIVR